jgi:transcription elongation factor GreB
MSKAFVKEDSDQLDADQEDLASDQDLGLDDDEGDGLGDDGQNSKAVFRTGKNYITQRGFDRLKSEVHELLTVERPKMVETVAWAASNGDRSENADYQYGKKRLREIDRRIRFLQKRMDIAEIVNPEKQSGEKVLFGATVTIEDEDGNTRVYKIVGIDETDAKLGKISWISPIGRALLQAKVGDAVLVQMPKGEEELLIQKIEFKDIP